MGFTIFAFLVIFLLIASGGMLLFYREAMLRRISEVVNPRPVEQRTLTGTVEKTSFSLSEVAQRFEQVLPKSEAEISQISQRLARAGYRSDAAVRTFNGSRVLIPLILAGVALVTGLGSKSPFFVYAVALGVGYLAPDIWLGRKIKNRQKRIRLGLPDVLDLLVVCVEAGLSLDQATARTTEELKRAHPDLCDELGIVVLEQRAGRSRSEAWKHLAERTQVDSVRNLVSMLVQAEQLGTSIAKTLRIHADTLRVQRVQQVEEQAAKTTIKLIFPLVFFIFPALFVVTIGPAAIIMMHSFKTLFSH